MIQIVIVRQSESRVQYCTVPIYFLQLYSTGTVYYSTVPGSRLQYCILHQRDVVTFWDSRSNRYRLFAKQVGRVEIVGTSSTVTPYRYRPAV